MENNWSSKSILLIISGGIAAYKSLELIRLIKKAGGEVKCILTDGGSHFVTPLSVSALCEHEVYTTLWSLKDEAEMGHIRLSREADLVVVAPASADIMAKMAHGLTSDLATTTLLASDKPLMIAPAMNPIMWNHPATQENIKTLNKRGAIQVGPNPGEMACGETGFGRMAEPEEIFNAIDSFFFEKPLSGYKALVNSGPTYEAIDPVRFIGNRSSGKQGHAIAKTLALYGADVTLVSGPTAQPVPAGVNAVHVESTQEMLNACEKALPVDIAVCAAAVCDWRPDVEADQKIKKKKAEAPPSLSLTENPDILHTICQHKNRPKLVVGFAAETQDLLNNARAKLIKKGCDMIVANNVGEEEIFGADENHVFLVRAEGEEEWPKASKTDIADHLVRHIIQYFEHQKDIKHAAE